MRFQALVDRRGEGNDQRLAGEQHEGDQPSGCALTVGVGGHEFDHAPNGRGRGLDPDERQGGRSASRAAGCRPPRFTNWRDPHGPGAGLS